MSIRPHRNGSATPEQLRHDIDTGRARDKVAFPDPAAAPLGTDEEAAGTPVSPQAAAMARASEATRARPAERRRRHGIGPGVVSAFVAIGGCLLAVLLLLHWASH